MTLGGSFLFAEEEGEISSERLLAGHSVLPLYNHRNPGGSGEGLCTPSFCRCRYTSMHKFNGQSRACTLCPNPNADRSLIQKGMYMRVRLSLFEHTKEQATTAHTHTHTNVCFLHYAPSSSNLLQWGNYEYSSCPVSPGLEFWL